MVINKRRLDFGITELREVLVDEKIFVDGKELLCVIDWQAKTFTMSRQYDEIGRSIIITILAPKDCRVVGRSEV